MSLNSEQLANNIVDKMADSGLFRTRIDSETFVDNPEAEAAALVNWKLICKEVIDHIKNNLEVTTQLNLVFGPVINSGIAVPYDGGSSLKTTQATFISTQSPNVNRAKSIKVE